MKTLAAAVLAAAIATAGPALAQPDMGGAPGIPGDQAVNPAPGATGPYIGAGRAGFYDVDARLARLTDAAAALPPAQRRRAVSGLNGIKSFEATQRARHGGELRDWDREAMSDKLDQLVQRFPSLRAGGPGQD